MPSGPQWVHEIKHDGYRFICRVEGNRIRVFSRRGNDYTDRVPRIVDTLLRLPASSVTLDGEGVACDPIQRRGHPRVRDSDCAKANGMKPKHPPDNPMTLGNMRQTGDKSGRK